MKQRREYINGSFYAALAGVILTFAWAASVCAGAMHGERELYGTIDPYLSALRPGRLW